MRFPKHSFNDCQIAEPFSSDIKIIGKQKGDCLLVMKFPSLINSVTKCSYVLLVPHGMYTVGPWCFRSNHVYIHSFRCITEATEQLKK